MRAGFTPSRAWPSVSEGFDDDAVAFDGGDAGLTQGSTRLILTEIGASLAVEERPEFCIRGAGIASGNRGTNLLRHGTPRRAAIKPLVPLPGYLDRLAIR